MQVMVAMRRSSSPVRSKVYAALCAAVMSGACVSAASAQIVRGAETPQRMLDDGLFALEENRTAVARKLFERLMRQHPGTVESGRAALELEFMAADDVEPGAPLGSRDDASRGVAIASSQMDEIRRAFLVEVGDRVFFAENSADIGGRARTVIDHQARWLSKRPELIVTIIGRADEGGSPEDAVALSNRRADAVRERLAASGVDRRRIFVDARGDRDPLAVCRSSLCRAQNRHAETMIGAPKQAGDTRSSAR
jgi:peptidoglycan-associated lipoprotein